MRLAVWRPMGITPHEFNRMQDRLRSRHRVAGVLLPESAKRIARPEILLGVDPSLRGTGYGAIRISGPAPQSLGHGTIHCSQGWTHSRCLVEIVRRLREVLTQYQPEVCVVEGIFYAQNLQTALIMGEARGAALATIAEAGVDIYELAPRKVKQAIVGYGGAQKLAVARMVQRMLRLAEAPGPDAADALALALAHAQEASRYNLAPKRKV